MKSLSYLNKYFFKYKWRFLLGILFIIASNIAKVEMPKYIGVAFDSLDEISGDNYADTVFTALKMGWGYILLALISGFFLFLTRQTIIIMSRHIEYDLKNEIYQQYQRLNYTFYRKNATGDLMNRISEDVSRVRMYLGPGLMYTLGLIVLFALSVVQMIRIDAYLTLFVLLPLPLMSYLIYKVSSRMNRLSTVVQKEQSHMSSLAQEYFSGIRVVKAYGGENRVRDKFFGSADEYLKRNMRLVMVEALFMPVIMILIGLSTLIVIYLGGLIYYSGDISQGDILAFIFYVNLLTWPFASIGWVTSIVQRAEASQTRINEFLKEEAEIFNPTEENFDFKGSIEFKNVTYTYPNSGITALNNLSFKINPGETLGIVGKTGCGKSTIVALLMRQIDPTEGEILIDGQPLKKINLNNFRGQSGIVPQDVFLFSDTIANNLRFGTTRELTKEDLIEATKNAHVYHNIQEFGNEFETILGERGVNISGGQKQRISIARALIRKPKLLILDDCLSAVDTETEEIILENLKKLKTLSAIIVSHRISSIRHATRVIAIDHGVKTEEGTHAELIALNGAYAEMYEKQLAEIDENQNE